VAVPVDRPVVRNRGTSPRILTIAGVTAVTLWLVACATAGAPDSAASAYAVATSQDPAARQSAAQSTNGKKPVWTVPTEEEVAAALEKKYLDATKDFVKLKKDGELRFCKRYREIGSSIARINCITEAEVRTQVDNMTQYRDDMRNKMGKCTRDVGCGGGG
jgi:hypothetical protein